MITINHVSLIGRPTNVPTLEISEKSGAQYCKVRMSVKRPYRRKPKKTENAKEYDFFNIMFFGKLAQYVAKYLAQGALFSVEGRLEQDNWRDGFQQNRESVDVKGEKISILEYRKKANPNDTFGEFEDLNLIPRDIAGNLFDKELTFDEDVPSDFL